MPMVFVAIGVVLGSGVTGLLPISPQTESMKALTEITLALLLFADVSTLKLREVQWRRSPAGTAAHDRPAADDFRRRGRRARS